MIEPSDLEGSVSDVKGGVRAAPECAVTSCMQPAFGREPVFCPLHVDEEMSECDGCGEMRWAGGGESHRDVIHAAMIDPPDEHWVCDECVARAEAHDEDRAMDAVRPMSDRDYYLYEK